MAELTVAHETAHQWFGDAVTAREWAHVWLSEGFATYFAELWTEHAVGDSAFSASMARIRDQIVRAEEVATRPVIDTTQTNLMELLNTNSYQKGGWTLHMLRHTIGTDTFWTGIREYYARYQNQNASTDDLREIMERVSGTELRWFFTQWLTRSGVPALAGTWSYDAAAKQVIVNVRQVQSGDAYRLPLEIGITTSPSAAPRVERVDVTGREAKFTFAADAEPQSVVLDPNTWLLMEPAQFAKR